MNTKGNQKQRRVPMGTPTETPVFFQMTHDADSVSGQQVDVRCSTTPKDWLPKLYTKLHEDTVVMFVNTVRKHLNWSKVEFQGLFNNLPRRGKDRGEKRTRVHRLWLAFAELKKTNTGTIEDVYCALLRHIPLDSPPTYEDSYACTGQKVCTFSVPHDCDNKRALALITCRKFSIEVYPIHTVASTNAKHGQTVRLVAMYAAVQLYLNHNNFDIDDSDSDDSDDSDDDRIRNNNNNSTLRASHGLSAYGLTCIEKINGNDDKALRTATEEVCTVIQGAIATHTDVANFFEACKWKELLALSAMNVTNEETTIQAATAWVDTATAIVAQVDDYIGTVQLWSSAIARRDRPLIADR